MEHADLSSADLSHAAWRKAKMSTDQATSGCVEVATNIAGVVAVRDSKNPERAPLVFTPHEWACFLDGAKNGEFELP
ncbi:DUF397 domain-containing protein [Spongiactinospora rosea]|uniref:DUF397 domain-containing protein n=1 Tax=Spongiactinospora rosea TaxID=2248750 RepID=A0A366LVD0_9ACTN|nr:DUF397 domain-containing protein [Spongiactinospora rosea]RBQ17142.1 DUF397 domain-containing protein [Spongiactinospora rosea]